MQQAMRSRMEVDGRVDVQATIKGRHGATSWDATIAIAGVFAKGTSILIRASSDLELLVDRHVRLLDVWPSEDSEGSLGVKVVSVGVQSEVYELD